MRVTSAILFLIAFTANLAAGSSAKKGLAGKKEDHVIDTTKNNEDAFLFESNTTKNKSEELIFSRDALKKILEERKTTRFLLGRSKQMQTIEAWFFPAPVKKTHLSLVVFMVLNFPLLKLRKLLSKNYYREEKIITMSLLFPVFFPTMLLPRKKMQMQLEVRQTLAGIVFPLQQIPTARCPRPDNLLMKDQEKTIWAGRSKKKINCCYG